MTPRRSVNGRTRRRPKKHSQQQHFINQKLVSLISTTLQSSHSFLLQNDLHLLPSQTLSLESLLSSTSISLSSLLPKPFPLSPNPPPTQHQSWFHRFLSSTSSIDSDPRWISTFRMSKPSFSLLLSLLSPLLDSSLPSVPPDFSLAATLYRLAHAASYKAVGRRFGMDSSDACRAFYTVCKAVSEKLGNVFEFRSDIERIVVGFGWISLPNCCGVLGIGKFGVENGKKNGSLLVQALVDSEGRFLDISAGWPNTMKPETILRQTKLYSGIKHSREFLTGPLYNLSTGISIPQYILGDSCFPLLPWLLTPFIKQNEGNENELSLSEKEFNSTHNRAMGSVSTAFGQVRGRWKLLLREWKEESIEFFPFVVVTGCLLHNFLIKCREPWGDENREFYREENGVFDGGVRDESGERVRNALALHLSGVSLRR